MTRRQQLVLLLVALNLPGDHPAQGDFFIHTANAKPAETSKVIRADLHGDPLPEGALARFGTIYLRSDFKNVAFRADGREFYSWNQAGLLRVYDAATGKVLRSLLMPVLPVAKAQFSANGHFLTLAVDRGAGDSKVRALTVWETTTGKLLHEIEPYDGESFSFWDASLHDGRTVLTRDSKSGAVRVWNLQRDTNRVLRDSSPAVNQFSYSPDGKRLFVQMEKSVACWDITDGKRLWERPINACDLKVAPDGQALLVCESTKGGTRLHILSTATGKEHPGLKPPPGLHDSPPAWGADGRTLLVPHSRDNMVRIWDLGVGKERGRLPWTHGAFVMAPDGKSLLGDDQGLQLQRWDLKTMKPLLPSTANRGHSQAVEFLACSPDGKQLVSADSEGTVCFWDMRTSRLIRVMHKMKCAALAFTPDNKRLLVGRSDKTLLVCDPTSGKVLNRWKLEGLPADFPGLGAMTIGEGDKVIIHQSTRDPLSERSWFDEPGPNGVAATWDIETGKRLWLRKVAGEELFAGLSPDGRLGVDLQMKLRDVETGKLFGRLAEKDEEVNVGATGGFSPDGSLIAMTAYRYPTTNQRYDNWKYTGIEVWERATCRLLRRLSLTLSRPFALAADGRRLVCYSGNELRIWDVVRDKELLHLRAPATAAHWRAKAIAFVPNGRALAMATEDGSILLFAVPPFVPGPPRVTNDAVLRRAWEELGDIDPAKAFVAAADLADQPGQSVALLKERLRPAAPIPAEQVRKLIAALDADTFEARESARRKLAALGAPVWPALRKVLGQSPSLEVRRRIELLLEAERQLPTTDVLRTQRALRALEWAGTPQARDLLRRMVAGDPDAPSTKEAKAALKRLE
jgi:WD40 repeat protein